MTLSEAYRFETGAAFGVGVAVLSLSVVELAGGRAFLWGAGLLLAPSLGLLCQSK
jgi:hypothetical protein